MSVWLGVLTRANRRTGWTWDPVHLLTMTAEFLDEAFGVTVGDSSELYYTTDGGQT